MFFAVRTSFGLLVLERDSALLKFVGGSNSQIFVPQKVWIDLGDNEEDDYTDNIESLGLLRDTLIQKGMTTPNLHYEVVPGGEHNETSWARRAARILKFLLTDRN